jgi:hypothetical protein
VLDLSIVIPSIRTEGWETLLDDISAACTKYTHEVIFVGPEAHECIKYRDNVKYVKDLGSPNRAQQIGLTLCEGKYVTWLVDDYETGPFHLDEFIDVLECETSTKTVVIGNYNEAGTVAVENFSIKHCYASGSFINPAWVIFNVAFMNRKYIEWLGGFDCAYQVTCLGHTDLAVRAQADGCKVINTGLNIGSLKHMPNITGDHGPVHYAQVEEDQPRFRANTEREVNTRVNMDNWKWSSPIWKRRFK